MFRQLAQNVNNNFITGIMRICPFSTSIPDQMYFKNTTDNFHGGRQRRGRRVGRESRIKGLNKQSLSFRKRQGGYMNGSKFEKGWDARVITNKLDIEDETFFIAKKGTQVNTTWSDEAHFIQSIKKLLQEKNNQLTEDEVSEILYEPNKLAEKINKNDFMQYLDFSKLKYAGLPDYYKYDPDRSMPKGFGPLDYSGK